VPVAEDETCKSAFEDLTYLEITRCPQTIGPWLYLRE